MTERQQAQLDKASFWSNLSKTSPIMEPEKRIDIEKTIQAILAKRSPFVSINEIKLREEIKKDPKFIIEAAEAVRAEIAYL